VSQHRVGIIGGGGLYHIEGFTLQIVGEGAVTPSLNGDDANLDLAFTNFNIGFYTNEATGEIGKFAIEPAQQLLPADWSGKTYTAKPADSTNTEALAFTSNHTFELKRAGGTYYGTYLVDNASLIGAFFSADITNTPTTRTLYFQVTFTSASAGFYEDNEYMNGTLVQTETGTFK